MDPYVRVKGASNELTLKRLTVTPSEIDHSSLKFGRKFFSDVNECKVDLHKYHSDANCENAEGSYNCTCKPEYIGDGFNCRPEGGSINFI